MAVYCRQMTGEQEEFFEALNDSLVRSHCGNEVEDKLVIGFFAITFNEGNYYSSVFRANRIPENCQRAPAGKKLR